MYIYDISRYSPLIQAFLLHSVYIYIFTIIQYYNVLIKISKIQLRQQ